MTFISDPTIDKKEFAKEALGGMPTMEDIVQKIAELEYLEEVEAYKVQRAAEYPDFGSQLDYIYHHGVDAWKADIVDPVKAAYPKQIIDDTKLALRKAQALFNYRLDEYSNAVNRLAQHELSVGQEEVTEEVIVGVEPLVDSDGNYSFDSDGNMIEINITEVRVVKEAIDPLPATTFESQFDSDGNPIEVEVPNPLIIKDEEERAAAQEVINNTEHAVIDHYSLGEIKNAL